VSIVLLAIGTTCLILGLRSHEVGPSIPNPIGKTSLPPSGLVAQAATFASLVDLTSWSLPPRLVASAASRTVSDGLPTLPIRMGHAVRPVTRSRPVHLTIAAIGVSAKVSILGLNANGSPAVPTNVNVPGWYKFGPTPGQRGSAVIVGHVDSYKGPAVFFKLADLRPGNRIVITLANHKKVYFKVIGLRLYLKSHFPDKLVYGSRSYSALQLVTCSGDFDPHTGHYLSNLVVFTAMVKK
jgi:hypothetical protein